MTDEVHACGRPPPGSCRARRGPWDERERLRQEVLRRSSSPRQQPMRAGGGGCASCRAACAPSTLPASVPSTDSPPWPVTCWRREGGGGGCDARPGRDPSGSGGAGADRRAPDERRDRRPAVHLRAHGGVARVLTPAQARRRRPAEAGSTRRSVDHSSVRPGGDAAPRPPSLPPALALLADDTTFVGRTARAGGAAPAVAAGAGRAHADRLRHRRGRDGQEPPRCRARCRRPRRRRHACCSARATRTSTSRTGRSSRRSSTTPPDSGQPTPGGGPAMRPTRWPGSHPSWRGVFGSTVEQQPSDDVDAFERSMVLDAIRQWFLDGAAAARHCWCSRTSTGRRATTQERACATSPAVPAATRCSSSPPPATRSPTSMPSWSRCSPTSSGSPSVRRQSLPGLGPDEVERARRLDRRPRPQVIRAETGGNPLLVTHMSSDAGQRSLPAWLVRRDALLDDESRAVLDHGGDVRLGVRRRSAGGRARRAAAASSRVARKQLRRPVSSSPTRLGSARFAFVHALFRSHRYGALPLRRRLELHARAAAALATPPDDDRVQSERARHACLALPLGDAREAVELVARRRAARRARLRLRRSDRPLPARARCGPVPRPTGSRRDPRPHGAHRRRAAPPR